MAALAFCRLVPTFFLGLMGKITAKDAEYARRRVRTLVTHQAPRTHAMKGAAGASHPRVSNMNNRHK